MELVIMVQIGRTCIPLMRHPTSVLKLFFLPLVLKIMQPMMVYGWELLPTVQEVQHTLAQIALELFIVGVVQVIMPIFIPIIVSNPLDGRQPSRI